MKILVVEDDVQLRELLERVFADEAHDVVSAGSLARARQALASSPFDVIVLDRMLPDGDGLDFCAQRQAQQSSIPILLLTARGELLDRVSGLRAGADDYLTKPFEVEELLARVEVLVRRRASSWQTTIGDMTIDRRAQHVSVAGKRLDLTSREYALLCRLADAGNESVSRASLLQDVWNMAFDPGSGVIDVHMSRLRDKLADYAWMVETVRGVGFRIRREK